MATELSIVISASAMIGGAMSAIRTLTGGLDSVRRSSNILGNEQRRLRSEIDRLSTSSAVPTLQRQYDRLGIVYLFDSKRFDGLHGLLCSMWAYYKSCYKR